MMLRMLSMPVCSVTSPTSRSRSRICGTSWMRIHRSCTCWRVVMSTSPRPTRLARPPMARSWAAVVTPFGMRSRIMK